MVDTKGHTYLKSHELRGRKLHFLLRAEDEGLLQRAQRSKTGRAAKTLVKEGALRITMVAMREGTELKQHDVEGPATFQCLRGHLRFRMSDEEVELISNSLLVLDAGVSHDVVAYRDSTFLITLSVAE